MATSPLPEPQDASGGFPVPALAVEACGGWEIAGIGHPTPRPDPLGPVLELVLNAVSSPLTKRSYAHSLLDFAQWRAANRCVFTRQAVQGWRASLEEKGLAASTINVRLAAIRKLAAEAAASGLLDQETAAGIDQVTGAKQRGSRTGNWLSQSQTQALIEAPEPNTLKGKRDRAALSLLVGCGLRRDEAVRLTFEDIQQRDGRWVIVDLVGKHGRIRTIPVPAWVKAAIDRYAAALPANSPPSGKILRGMNRHGKITHDSLSGQAALDLAVEYGRGLGLEIRPHDLRRTCAKLCRRHGGELEQIQLLLGHASVQTTERYLGTKQDLTDAPNDHMGLKWRNE